MNLFARAFPLAVIAVCAASASPAAATTGHGPQYSLKIVEGETTLPEYESVASTSATVNPSAQIALSIIRGGVTVERKIGEKGSAGFSQVPQIGDTVTLESPVGTLIASSVYDGLPTADPTVCAGSTNFSGQNSPGQIVEGSFVQNVPLFDPYHRFIRTYRAAFGEAQVKTLSGTSFGGSFLTPLALGQTVGAVETLKTPLAGEATYTYISEDQRPVGACPVPPPVYNPPPPPVVLGGSIAKLLKTTIHAFLRFGASDQVTIDLPGTVTQDLYLTGGKLPAFATATHHKKFQPALLLARGSVTAKAAGKVTVLLKLTARGRHKLKSSRKLTVVLITTLRSISGAKIDLQRHTITLHR
jgi:hypothetical protein